MGTYAQLANVRTWYDERGDGEPLVLLHGGVVDARFFAGNIDALAAHFHVFALDLRGHGHTADVEGPFSYEVFAQDTIEFLETVVQGPAHFVGHSVGAGSALIVALRRPELVRDLVLISGAYHHDGLVTTGADEPDIDQIVAGFGAAYGEVSPDGEAHYPVVVAKVMDMDRRDPDLAREDLRGVASRALVMTGDDDIITLEHTLDLYRGITNSELAVVPGTSHFLVQEKPEACNTIIVEFLTTEPVATIAPVRRAG
jgi:pimeloyl-ACP methyl ester carboxylesterase